MIEKNNIFFISSFIYSVLLSLMICSCGDSYELSLKDTPQDSDLTRNGVKIIETPSSFYDNLLKELFENESITRTDKEIFYFNFDSAHVANSDTLANSSLICSDTGINTIVDSSIQQGVDSFLRTLRMKLDEYNIKDNFDIAITRNKPSGNKYATIYITRSYADTYCSEFSSDLNGLVRYDRANVKQDDSAFIFYKEDNRNLEELIHSSIDVIFTMLGVERTNTSKYDYSNIPENLGHNNINSMARLLWETKGVSGDFDLSLFQEDLDRILVANLEVSNDFKKIMQVYTEAISSDSSSNKSSSILQNLSSIFKNLANEGERINNFLNRLKNKEQSSLPDFDSYLELDEIDQISDLIYVYNNQISFIKDQNYDIDTFSSLKSMLMVGFLQRYYKIKNSSI